MAADDHGDRGAQRVAKLIARAGLCSRREAERWIEQGRVTLDGETMTSPAVAIDDPARLKVDGRALPAVEGTRLFRLHKPTGVLTAERDPEGRTTIYDVLPAGLPRLMPIGRLDLNSEGLLLLTNDGELKRRLELPATGWLRRYRVRVFGHPAPETLARLADGVTVDGVRYGAIEAQVDETTASNAWVTVALREGKNREVRRVMEHLGFRVSRLIRVAYGPFQLGAMKPGQVKEVTPKVLAEQLGIDQAPARKTGTAKRKPARAAQKPRAGAAKPQGSTGAGGAGPKDGGSQDRKPHAHRRRKT